MEKIDSKCPYKGLPATNYWRRSVGGVAPGHVDPVIDTKFKIDPTEKVATAGSCFAQHIARYLSNSGFNYYVAETAHPLIPAQLTRNYNYGVFSCRYGNIYTARQLLQLLRRAFGTFVPAEDEWYEDGVFIDPFRPHIQEKGFPTEAELVADRASHLAAVRRMIAEMDVFVFTLGLTETWRSKIDGSVFPVCPGCGAGTFESRKYEFLNLSVDEVVHDVREALTLIRNIKPSVKVVLTVSPVPLIATYSKAHVLAATTYSKAVLRVAAEQICAGDPLTDYFPSFEIITGSHSQGKYYAPDLREVMEDGVRHVMKVFMSHYTGVRLDENVQPTNRVHGGISSGGGSNALVAAIVCEEENLDR